MEQPSSSPSPGSSRRRAAAAAESGGRLARAAVAVLVAGAALFAIAWLVGGDDAVSDNWVGATVAVALLAGLLGSFAAMVVAVSAGLRHEPWSRLWLPLAAFPAVVAALGLLEAFVLE